jgi:hypothetical protein
MLEAAAGQGVSGLGAARRLVERDDATALPDGRAEVLLARRLPRRAPGAAEAAQNAAAESADGQGEARWAPTSSA